MGRVVVEGNGSPAPNGTGEGQSDAEQSAGLPVHLLRGNASAEELSALIAVVVVLASADGNADDPDQAGGSSSRGARRSGSAWSSPTRRVRSLLPHGPGGWRASAAPR